jgi:Flp pilus assembly protein TadG
MNTKLEFNQKRRAKTAFTCLLRKSFKDESGQTLPFVALAMTALLGVCGLVVDVGHAYVVRSQLQNSANASALAAAGYVYTAQTDTVNTTTMANEYGAVSGGQNVYSAGTVTTTVATKCVNILMPKGTSCSSSSSPNAVQVVNTTKVNTSFMGIFGVKTLSIGATATASMQGVSLPWNVAIIVDSTGSMATVDSNCGSLTEFQCALSGTQALLESTPPCPSVDTTCTAATANVRMSLFTFPNVLTAVNSKLPVVNGANANSINDDTSCNGSPATYSTSTRQPIAAPYTLPVPGATLPVYTSANAPSTDMVGLQYLTYSNKSGSTTTTWDASYQITPFLSDYYSPTASSGLSSTSALVQAVGYGSTKGCLTYTFGVDGATGGGSNFGNTYLASSIYAAQSALTAEQAAYGGRNAIIFLSDGESNASYYSKNSSTYGTSNSTNQYVDATEFPEGPAGSEVGPSTSSYKVPAYYTPATVLTAQNTLAYDTLSSSSSSSGQKRSGTTKGTYPDWYDQCQQAIKAGQYAANKGTTVFAVAYGSESSGCSNGWSVGITDTAVVSTGTNQTYSSISHVLPCTTMEDIASAWTNFYSDNQQTGNVNLGCSDLNHTTVSLQDIFQAIASTFTTPRLIPSNAT